MTSPIRYIGNEVANIDYHHGQLRPLVGAGRSLHRLAFRTGPARLEPTPDTGTPVPQATYSLHWLRTEHAPDEKL